MSTTVYVLRDKERPDVGSLRSYHETLEEAQACMARSKRFSREFPEPDGQPGSEYLEIVVEQIDWIPCAVCSGHVTSKNPERYPYCRSCHYTGAAAEHVRAEQLLYFRTQLPEAEVYFEHTGGGCMWMAIYFPKREGREYLAATDGDASLPAEYNEKTEEWTPIRGGWGYLGVQYNCLGDACPTDGEPCCGSGEGPVLHWAGWPKDGEERDPEDLIADDVLVTIVRDWLDGKIVPEGVTA